VEGEEAEGGEVGEGSEEISLATMGSGYAGRVEGGGRTVGWVAEMRVLRVEGRLWREHRQ
jgi:hypothetical protein